MATTGTSNVFNDIAEMIFQLQCLNREVFDDEGKRNSRRPDNVEKAAKEFISNHPDLQQDGKKLLSNGISPETMRALRAWPTGKTEQVRFYYLLEVLLELERRIGTTDLLKSSFYTQLTNGGTKEFTSLNSNVGDTRIFILPKIQSIYSPPSSGEPEQKNALNFVGARRPGIGEELRNIYYYESGDLQIGECSYRARHSVLNVPGSNDEENQIQKKQKVTIAVSPLTNQPLAPNECSFYDLGTPADPDRRFSVQFRDSTNQLARRILKDIEAAGNEGVDIVIFPEMYGCKETVTATDALEDPLPEANVLARAAKSLGEKLPRLILLPTWWHDHTNDLYVRSSPERVQCVQQKQFPFPCQRKEDELWYREDLQGQDHVIHMVHIPGLGRFAFPICRDIIEETDYVNLMRKTLWATFLLCPSYSPGKTQFLQRGSTQEFGCYTVWCNACVAAYSDGRPANYVGFVASPLLSEERITYFQPQCNGKCGPDGVCLFLIDLKWDGSELSGSVEPYRHIYH